MNDIETLSTDLVADLYKWRRAITYRGGEISATAGFKELVRKVPTLPTSSSIGTVIDESTSLLKIVPSNSTKFCYLKSLGGMTYKSNNLIPYPYAETTKTVNGITFTDNGNGTITLNGTAEAIAAINIGNMIEFPKGVYTISGFPSALSDKGYLAVVFQKDSTYVQEMTDRGSGATRDASNLDFNNIRVTLRLEAGAVCNNLTIKPMLNRGSTALPYEPYYKGLLDTKPTAIRVHGANLIPFPYDGGKDVGYTYTTNGVTYTVNADRSITIDGTATINTSVIFGNYYNLPDGDYVFSANHISGEWVSGAYIRNTAQDMRNNHIVTKFTSPTRKLTWWGVYVEQGTTVSNLTFKPILNRGSTALSYTDYKEPVTYPIPEALQGTGKGINSTYHDSVDFEKGKAITEMAETLMKPVFDAGTGMSSYGFYTYRLQNKFVGNMLLCDAYNTDTWGNVYGSKTDRCIAGNGSAIILSDSRYADIASFRASLTDEKLMYATATPTETDIDTSSFNPLIEVEAGGSIEFITDSGKAPNSTIIYQTIL